MPSSNIEQSMRRPNRVRSPVLVEGDAECENCKRPLPRKETGAETFNWIRNSYQWGVDTAGDVTGTR
jgi:hypothetical protein